MRLPCLLENNDGTIFSSFGVAMFESVSMVTRVETLIPFNRDAARQYLPLDGETRSRVWRGHAVKRSVVGVTSLRYL